MKQTLNILTLIKASIIAGDREAALLQINKLKAQAMEIDNDVLAIVGELDDFNYSKAIMLIEDYLSKHSDIVPHIDKELQGLKLELIALEERLEALTLSHVECLNAINEFNALQDRVIGPIIVEIMQLKAQINEVLGGSDDYSEELNKQFENAQQEYEEFWKAYNATKNHSDFCYDLSDDNKKLLKRLYKKASRLCHPDKVSEKLKPQANQIFSELNKAYVNNDLPRVEEILEELEKGVGFALDSYSIDDKEVIQAQIKKIRQKIQEAEAEIQKVKADKIYKIIEENDDIYSYLEQMTAPLEKERDELRETLLTISS
jgi:hypothetical protein